MKICFPIRISVLTCGLLLSAVVVSGQQPDTFKREQTLITTRTDPAGPVTPVRRTELFNGKDFTGWKFYMRTNADPAQTWSIRDGIIVCSGRPHGYMRTERGYRDYRVTVEWRFTQAGNTGVTVHMQEPDAIWPATIECQGQHDRQGDFWMQGGATCKDHTTRETRRAPMREASNENPLGEWNTYAVECAGDVVRIYVNGKLMNEATECSVSSGYIGLQSEGAGLEIRKVFVEPLNPAGSSAGPAAPVAP